MMKISALTCAGFLSQVSGLLHVGSSNVPCASTRPILFACEGLSPSRHHDPECSIRPLLSCLPSAARDHRGSQRSESHFSRSRRSRSTKLCLFKRSFDTQVAGRAVARLRGGGGTTSAEGTAKALAPPLTSWIGPALSCGLSYALYNLFIKRASSVMDPMLGGVVLQSVAAAMGTVLWLVTSSSRQSLVGGAAGGPPPTTATTTISRAGVGWSVAAGVAVGLAEILSFVISSRGVPAMQSIPIVVGGSVWFGTILAAVWLRERVSWRGWVGVALISVGVALVGMDPGSSAASR